MKTNRLDPSAPAVLPPHARDRPAAPEEEGKDKKILEAREETYLKARREKPNRRRGGIRDWNWVEVAHLDPPLKKEREVWMARCQPSRRHLP